MTSTRTLVVLTVLVSLASAGPPLSAQSGDVNGDAVVDLLDALEVCQFLAGILPSLAQEANADVDGDGAIDGEDRQAILSLAVRSTLGQPLMPSPPALDPFQAITSSLAVSLSGSAPGSATVEISGPDGVFGVDVVRGLFSADVPLAPNSISTIHLTAVSDAAVRSAARTIVITNDIEPPRLFIDFPPDNSELTTDATDVAGRVGDVLTGFMGLTVVVNGVEAIVDVGIGTNGTFLAQNVILDVGRSTTVTATATDILGNTIERSISVNRIEVPVDSPLVEVLSGNGQAGPASSVLAEPLVVRVSHGDGTAFVDKIVTFNVTRSDGLLGDVPDTTRQTTIQKRTDAAGEARVFWQLGADAGCGNNRVRATSAGIPGSAFFCATSTPGVARQINIGAGNNQRSEAGGPASERLRVWVGDSRNGVARVPVTFKVTAGGGAVDGAEEVVMLTSVTGHASVDFTLGPVGGNNVVLADFPNNAGDPVEFVLFGVARTEGQPTTFSTLVFDNGNAPIEGAECSLSVAGQAVGSRTTDSSGHCEFADIPAGPSKLFVDGLLATAVGGVPVAPGSFPSLQFEQVIVPNVRNTTVSPVLLPPLNPANARIFDNTQDMTLTVEGIEGLAMIVRVGSMRRADGTIPSAADPAIISLNRVNFDDVPMPMPDGAAPPFAWTLQPAGAHFDPPIEITYPNMSGLSPGAIAYFLSFNHETARFDVVATGSVSADGAQIVSDPGDGLTVSGWGCNCPPYSVTGTCEACGDSDKQAAVQYDSNGRLKSVEFSDGSIVAYDYDDHGNKFSEHRYANDKLVWAQYFDVQGRVVREDYGANGQTVVTRFFNDGSKESTTTEDGVSATVIYNNLGEHVATRNLEWQDWWYAARPSFVGTVSMSAMECVYERPLTERAH